MSDDHIFLRELESAVGEDWRPNPATVTGTTYTISRIPDDSINHEVWSIKVEAAGYGRWAIRNVGRCLNKDGQWVHEPLPSSRTDKWLDTVRWDDRDEAIAVALAAEPNLTWNGMTPDQVV